MNVLKKEGKVNLYKIKFQAPNCIDTFVVAESIHEAIDKALKAVGQELNQIAFVETVAREKDEQVRLIP